MSIRARKTIGLFALALACFGLVATGAAWAEDDGSKTEGAKEEAPKVAEIGKKAPALKMTDTEGHAFDLHDCSVSKKDAEAVVMAAAKKFGAGKDASLKTKIADLSGVKDDDGDVDESKCKDLASACGMFAGLVATDESAKKFKTLGDLATWVHGANEAPILLVIWSPRCPSVKSQSDAIVETGAASGVRIFAIASNARDSDEDYAKYKDAFEWNIRVFPDREQKATDIVGGKKTPHYFLFDKDAVLRYKGALNNDPMGYMDDEERDDYIVAAAVAIKAGKSPAQSETKPSG